jgi:hypothetical protein
MYRASAAAALVFVLTLIVLPNQLNAQPAPAPFTQQESDCSGLRDAEMSFIFRGFADVGVTFTDVLADTSYSLLIWNGRRPSGECDALIEVGSDNWNFDLRLSQDCYTPSELGLR